MAFNTALKAQKKVKWIEGYDLHPEFLNDDQNTKVVNQVSLDTSCSSETQNSKINYVDEHPDSLLVVNTVSGNVHLVQQNQVVKTAPDSTVLDGTEQTNFRMVGLCFRCSLYGHHSNNCLDHPGDNTHSKRDYGNTTYVKTHNNAGFPVYLLPSDPPLLTQQLTTQSRIDKEAWTKMQELLNDLAQKGELPDKHTRELGRTNKKWQFLAKQQGANAKMFKPKTSSKNKNYKSNDKKTSKKTPLTTTKPTKPDRNAMVNIIHYNDDDSDEKLAVDDSTENPQTDEDSSDDYTNDSSGKDESCYTGDSDDSDVE